MNWSCNVMVLRVGLRRACYDVRNHVAPLTAALGLAAAVLASTAVPAAAQTTITLRPTAHDASNGFGNPDRAYDTGQYGTPEFTSASKVLTAQCNLTCTSAVSVSGIWHGVQDGYAATELRVRWNNSASFGIVGGVVVGKIEYTLNYDDPSPQWSLAEEYSWSATSPSCSSQGGTGYITCIDHEKQITLPEVRSSKIAVRATLTAQLTACPFSCSTAHNLLGQLNVYDIKVIAPDCKIPINETSASMGWESSPLRTAHNFLQTLTPAGLNSFSGRAIVEADGGDTQDTCHFTGSDIPKVETIVSDVGNWTVASNNTWGTPTDPFGQYDTVGWSEDAVNYYQAVTQASKPCSIKGSQIMFISCQSTFVPYITNILESTIDVSSITVRRGQALPVSKTWP